MKQFSILAIVLACSLAAAAQSITGVVTNGTTNKPAAGDNVILLKLGQGMEEEAHTTTNAKGEFSFKIPPSDGMHLVRVRHQDVNYHEPVLPNSPSVHVTVYNSKTTVPEVKVVDQSEVYQAGKDQAGKEILQVIELFRVSNSSQPPVTQPTFEFYLPEGATVESGQASAGSMPIKSAPVPLSEKNRYAMLYPVRPGDTHFEIVYILPYTGSLKVAPKLAMAPEKFYVITPKSMKVTSGNGTALQTADSWPVDATLRSIDTHVADTSKPGTQLAFEISGSGMLVQDEPGGPQSGSGGQAAAQEGPGGGLGVPNEKPDPLHSAQWLLLGILVVCLAGGAAFVYFSNRQPVPAVAGAVSKPAGSSSTLLEAMKEEIFQLETDRLQGKISQDEYESAKSALDKTLQRAMKRQGK